MKEDTLVGHPNYRVVVDEAAIVAATCYSNALAYVSGLSSPQSKLSDSENDGKLYNCAVMQLIREGRTTAEGKMSGGGLVFPRPVAKSVQEVEALRRNTVDFEFWWFCCSAEEEFVTR